MSLLRHFIAIAFLLITFVPVNLFGQTEELTPSLAGTTTKDDQTTTQQVPSPLELFPNWWHYFEGDSEALNTKVNTFLSQLDELSNTISDEHKTTTNEYITRIKASLKALAELKKTQTKSEIAPAPFKEKYTLDELQTLERSLRELESIYKTESPTFKDNQKATKALAGKIDTLNAAYRKLDTTNHVKLVAGLEIVANRLGWLVSTLKEPIQKEQLKIQDIRIKRLTEEIEYAQTNLTVTENELKVITNEIEKQQAMLELSQKRFIDAQSQTLEIIEDDLTSSLKSRLLKQKSLLADIQSTREEVHLNYLQAKKSTMILMLQSSEDSTDELVKQYKNRDSLLKKIQGQNETWHSLLMKEINLLVETTLDKDSIYEYQKDSDQTIKDRKDVARSIALALRELSSSIGDLSFLNNVVRNQLTKIQGPLFKLRSDSTYTLGELWKGTQNLFSKSLFSIADVPVTASDILRALIILLIAYFISRLVRKILTRISGPSVGRTSPVFYTLGRLSHYLILAIGLIIALASIGINFTNLAIVAGALGVGIGFGLQSIVNNFVSGIIVLFEQHVKVGDFVQLDSGMNGVVKGIHVRSTVVTTLDNLDIIVPNSELVTAKVINYTMNEPMFRIHVPFGVAYGSDKIIVEKAGLEAAKNVEVTYDDGAKRRPQVWLVGFGDSSLNFELIVWVVNKKGSHATPGSWKALYAWEIETALQKYGIVIPFPQRDLHLKSGFEDK